jgi:hypothetical protein
MPTAYRSFVPPEQSDFHENLKSMYAHMSYYARRTCTGFELPSSVGGKRPQPPHLDVIFFTVSSDMNPDFIWEITKRFKADFGFITIHVRQRLRLLAEMGRQEQPAEATGEMVRRLLGSLHPLKAQEVYDHGMEVLGTAAPFFMVPILRASVDKMAESGQRQFVFFGVDNEAVVREFGEKVS